MNENCAIVSANGKLPTCAPARRTGAKGTIGMNVVHSHRIASCFLLRHWRADRNPGEREHFLLCMVPEMERPDQADS